MGNSSIRHMTAQGRCLWAAFLMRQGLSCHMPGLGTLLSTKNVHIVFAGCRQKLGQQGKGRCPKMTLGKFIVLDQRLRLCVDSLHTILSTKCVHNRASDGGYLLPGRGPALWKGLVSMALQAFTGISWRLHLSKAVADDPFRINDLAQHVHDSSHLYPQKMCRCEFS